MSTIFIGAKGESKAAKFLKEKGYKIIKRNYKKTFGEIDIIARKGDLVSFVEVKTRNGTDYGLACEAVTNSKKMRIIKTAMAYINEYNIDENYSFDVIEVYHLNGKIQKIEHIENAFC